MSKCDHRDAYAGTVDFKDLRIHVYVCEECERVRVEKEHVFRVGY